MGSCVSSTRSFLSRNNEGMERNPAVLGITISNLNTTRSAFNDGYETQRSLFNNVDWSSFEQESDRNHILRTHQYGHASIDPSSCDSQSSTDSSGSDSLGIENMFSFDGMNKRVSNRYDIGLNVLKAKIHHGADPKNLCTHGGRTSLMFSVMANDLSFIKQLVELGVDINQKNQSDETALSLAIGLKREEIAMYLRSQGATEVRRP